MSYDKFMTLKTPAIYHRERAIIPPPSITTKARKFSTSMREIAHAELAAFR